nr:GntR family transcriptional regulator [uncultured Sphingorhabdus sp.]
MSPAHVLEPTYQDLKRGLMQGRWRPGERLEALRLADDFGVSMTPVRDCLNRLAGEGLVEMKPGDGFRVPRISEKMLRDMLDLNAMLLDFALQTPIDIGALAHVTQSVEDYAGRVAALFGIIAHRSANTALIEIVHSLGDRMHAVRRWEPQLYADCFHELDGFELYLTDNSRYLNIALRKYHDRRLGSISELVQLAQS